MSQPSPETHPDIMDHNKSYIVFGRSRLSARAVCAFVAVTGYMGIAAGLLFAGDSVDGTVKNSALATAGNLAIGAAAYYFGQKDTNSQNQNA